MDSNQVRTLIPDGFPEKLAEIDRALDKATRAGVDVGDRFPFRRLALHCEHLGLRLDVKVVRPRRAR
jgi:hypothetical protein